MSWCTLSRAICLCRKNSACNVSHENPTCTGRSLQLQCRRCGGCVDVQVAPAGCHIWLPSFGHLAWPFRPLPCWSSCVQLPFSVPSVAILGSRPLPYLLAQPTIFRNLNQNTLDLRANRNSSKYFRFKVKEQFSAVSVHAVNTTEKKNVICYFSYGHRASQSGVTGHGAVSHSCG